MRETVRAWDRFWFSPMDPTTLGLMRLCCGFMAFYVTITYSWGLFAYVGQPPVIGEVVAGILLGPSVLGQIVPDGPSWLLPPAPR